MRHARWLIALGVFGLVLNGCEGGVGPEPKPEPPDLTVSVADIMPKAVYIRNYQGGLYSATIINDEIPEELLNPPEAEQVPEGEEVLEGSAALTGAVEPGAKMAQQEGSETEEEVEAAGEIEESEAKEVIGAYRIELPLEFRMKLTKHALLGVTPYAEALYKWKSSYGYSGLNAERIVIVQPEQGMADARTILRNRWDSKEKSHYDHLSDQLILFQKTMSEDGEVKFSLVRRDSEGNEKEISFPEDVSVGDLTLLPGKPGRAGYLLLKNGNKKTYYIVALASGEVKTLCEECILDPTPLKIHPFEGLFVYFRDKEDKLKLVTADLSKEWTVAEPVEETIYLNSYKKTYGSFSSVSGTAYKVTGFLPSGEFSFVRGDVEKVEGDEDLRLKIGLGVFDLSQESSQIVYEYHTLLDEALEQGPVQQVQYTQIVARDGDRYLLHGPELLITGKETPLPVAWKLAWLGADKKLTELISYPFKSTVEFSWPETGHLALGVEADTPQVRIIDWSSGEVLQTLERTSKVSVASKGKASKWPYLVVKKETAQAGEFEVGIMGQDQLTPTVIGMVQGYFDKVNIADWNGKQRDPLWALDETLSPGLTITLPSEVIKAPGGSVEFDILEGSPIGVKQSTVSCQGALQVINQVQYFGGSSTEVIHKVAVKVAPGATANCVVEAIDIDGKEAAAMFAVKFEAGVEGAVCGDAVCQDTESCSSCPLDCVIGCPQPGSLCGNGTCDADEGCNVCIPDCGKCGVGGCLAVCGDGICYAPPCESCEVCPQDCGMCPIPDVCSDGVCTAGETCESCPADCEPCEGPPVEKTLTPVGFTFDDPGKPLYLVYYPSEVYPTPRVYALTENVAEFDETKRPLAIVSPADLPTPDIVCNFPQGYMMNITSLAVPHVEGGEGSYLLLLTASINIADPPQDVAPNDIGECTVTVQGTNLSKKIYLQSRWLDTKPETYCGDDACNGEEDMDSCAIDCTPTEPVDGCGDTICDSNAGETCSSCPEDCDVCEGDETQSLQADNFTFDDQMEPLYLVYLNTTLGKHRFYALVEDVDAFDMAFRPKISVNPVNLNKPAIDCEYPQGYNLEVYNVLPQVGIEGAWRLSIAARANVNDPPKDVAPTDKGTCTITVPGTTLSKTVHLKSRYLATKPVACGDGTCDDEETCSSCSGDCGECLPTPANCGNDTCDSDENCLNCPGDCGSCPIIDKITPSPPTLGL